MSRDASGSAGDASGSASDTHALRSDVSERGSEDDGAQPRDALRFEELHLHRAPGFENETLYVSDLSPDVTVVHGPNASGKTTLANAIQWCCWPSAAPDVAEVSGQFALDGADWRVDVDRGRASYQRDGQDVGAPSLPAAGQRDRYRLALHDLLQRDVDGADLASVIERESAGGFDLDAAHDALGFDDTTATRGKQEVQRAETALKDWRQAQRDLQSVEDERQELPRLERQLEQATEARHRAELLDQAIEHAQARDAVATATDRLEAFPDALAELDGDELERVRELEDEIEDWEARIETAREDRQAAERELERVDLPDDGLPEGLLDRLRTRVDRLETLEERERQFEADLDRATNQQSRARANVPLEVDPGALDDLDAEVWSDLDAFARAAQDIRADRRLHQTVERWLESDERPETDLATLQRGRQAMEQWLATPPAADATDDRERTATTIGAVAAAVVAGAAVLLSVLVHPALLALALVGVALLWYGRRAEAAEPERGDDPRVGHRERIEQLDLAPPAEWTEAAVRERLTECYDAIAAHRLDRERADRRDALLDDQDALEQRETELDRRRAQLRDALGAAPEASDLDLVATADAIRRWQERDEEVQALQSKLETARDQHANVAEALAEDLAPYDRGEEYGTIEDAAAAAQAVASLENRASRHADAREQRAQAVETVERAEDRLQALREDREAIYRRANVEPGDRDTLRQRCERVAAYQEAAEEHAEAEAVARKEREDLQSHPDYEPELAERDVADLREERREVEATAERSENLQKAVSEVKATVDAAKADATVETARAEADRALDELADQFEADAAASVGDALVEHCREASVEASRPAVFGRARQLLARITGGRYRLDLEADGETFRAYDTVRERGLALEACSSGTQLQVLLAVRLAFVEHQEQGVALPLVLDETLANSDDERARVIVDAVLELARAGRQVLYFTAQGDEVAKWRDALADAEDVDYAEVDLAERRGLAEHVRIPDFAAGSSSASASGASPPDPAGHDHASYGAALDVPPFDPRLGAGSAHCWYLTDDVEVLSTLLELGVERWGQLDTLFEHGLEDLVADDPAVRERLRRRGHALETFVECWQRGRGQRVTRDALEATDAVTETFLDDVTELARSVDGDARRILEALDDGAVDRFRSKKVDELADFFEAEGYLDPIEPLAPGEIRVRVIATLVEHGLDRNEATSEADALFERIERSEGEDQR